MSQGRLIAGLIIMVFGFSLLFDTGILNILFPLLVIWIGLVVLLGHSSADRITEGSATEEDELHRVLIFSGINKKFTSSDFTGGEVVAIFGGGEIDLGDVKTKQKNIDFSAVAIFGGLKIIVPESWAVHSEGVGILGGFDNRARSGNKKSVNVYLRGTAIFGGVEIVN